MTKQGICPLAAQDHEKKKHLGPHVLKEHMHNTKNVHIPSLMFTFNCTKFAEVQTRKQKNYNYRE